MAQVLYGVASDTNGHCARALAIANRLPEHEFHFVGGDRLVNLIGDKYPVTTVPVLSTSYHRNRVDILDTCLQGSRYLAGFHRVRHRLLDLIDSWQPDLAITDWEFSLPRAARAAGVPCVSIDHHHILSACRYPVPVRQRIPWSLAMTSLRLFHESADRNLVVSFYQPELKPSVLSELLPPVLRPAVTEITARPGEHVLIYQTTSTFAPLINAARQLARPVIVYGFRNAHVTEGNITFKPFDSRGMLEDLAGSAYAVVNGGHNVICEALYYRKPVLCFPVAGLFEQYLNAWHVRTLGYGDFSTGRAPTPALFHKFEARLDDYRARLAKVSIDGTTSVVNRIRNLINHRGAA
ncbi:MAG: glycosyltransferase family protein [Verrucomicrobiota bacterium]